MKKYLLALGCVLCFGLNTVSAQSNLFDNATIVGAQNFLTDLRNTTTTINSGVNDIRGVVGVVSGTVNEVDEIWCIAIGDCTATPEGSFELPDADKFNTIGQNVSLRQYILNVLNFVLSFLGLIAVMALIYAGFLYVTAGGDDSVHEKSKKIVLYAVIGILLILASFAIVNTVIRNAGVGTDDRNNISNQPAGEVTVDPITGQPILGGGNINPNLRDQLINPIVIEGDGVQDGGDTVFVSLETAQQGLNFGVDVANAYSIIDFGDGIKLAIDTGVNPNLRVPHQYGEAGTYRVLVLVQTADSQISGFRKTIVVGGLEANITGPNQELLVNAEANLSARSSRNQTGTITSYNWTCSGCTFSNSTASETSVSFPNAGEQTVTLEITNSLGQSSQAEAVYQVIGDTPVADFRGQSTQNNNRPGEFRFSAHDSVNIKGVEAGLTYHWDLDGIKRQTNNPELIYNFPNAGSVNVELYVTQNFAGQTLRSETVSQTFEVPSTLSVDFDVY